MWHYDDKTYLNNYILCESYHGSSLFHESFTSHVRFFIHLPLLYLGTQICQKTSSNWYFTLVLFRCWPSLSLDSQNFWLHNSTRFSRALPTHPWLTISVHSKSTPLYVWLPVLDEMCTKSTSVHRDHESQRGREQLVTITIYVLTRHKLLFSVLTLRGQDTSHSV